MKAPRCRSCGKEHWGSVCHPEKSTAARKDVQDQPIAKHGPTGVSVNGDRSKAEGRTTSLAGTQALPVDTDAREAELDKHPVVDRKEAGSIPATSTNPPKPFSKTEYQKQYMADQRTIKRLGLSVTVAQYRKSKET